MLVMRSIVVRGRVPSGVSERSCLCGGICGFVARSVHTQYRVVGDGACVDVGLD